MFWRKKNKIRPEKDAPSANSSLEVNLPVKVVVRTDLGNVRTNNEDSVLYKKVEGGKMNSGAMLLVADGMGGHLAGEVASRMAAEIITESFFHQPQGKSIPGILSSAFVLANKKIFESASSNELQKGMGTTCTVLVLSGSCVYFAHAGDSRAYHLGKDGIKQITTDHTYVQELVNNGSISLEEADTHPQRNILTNAMGTKPNLKVDAGCYSCNMKEGDKLLVCSDGLYDYFNTKELGNILSGKSLEEIADYLISEAKSRGGHDNISLILAGLGNVGSDKTNGKETREAGMIKITRDAEIPNNQTES